jgi:hypothetical protein
VNGQLEVDYASNRVIFYPDAPGEPRLALPLQPLDVDIAQSLSSISARLRANQSNGQ